MGRVLFIILPLAFGLVLFPYTTNGVNVKSVAPTNQSQSQSQGPNPLIEKACGNALHKSLCIDTLKAHPGSANADIKTLAFLSLNITKTYGSSVAQWISQKIDEAGLEPAVDQGLTDCSDQYFDALAQLEDAIVAFFSNAYNDINTWVSTAMTDANTCEEELKEEKVKNAMGNRNQVFAQHCSNALAIVNALAKQQ